jgi:high affinity Mn2+ porin
MFNRMISIAAAAAMCAAALPAAAADMPVKAPTLSIPGAQWSGFYLGIHAAGAKTSGEFDFVTLPGTGSLHPTGIMPGVTVGVGSWLGGAWIGVEADASYDFAKTNNPCIVVLNCSIKNSFFLTQRGVLGIALPALTGAVQSRAPSGGNWPSSIQLPANVLAAQVMPYVTAGIAERRIEACVDSSVLGLSQGCGREWLVGWTAGGGLRIPVSQHVSLDLSYLYVGWNKNFVPASTVAIFPGTFEAKSEQIAKLAIIGHY